MKPVANDAFIVFKESVKKWIIVESDSTGIMPINPKNLREIRRAKNQRFLETHNVLKDHFLTYSKLK